MGWYSYGYGGYGWGRRPNAAQRQASARRESAALAKKKGRPLQPVVVEGRKIATTFWGKAWCENLERYSDYANRLPRGRTYVRSGSVIDLEMSGGKVTAHVSGSEVYTVTIEITPLAAKDWTRIKADCSKSIDSLMDLLQGKFAESVMERLTRKGEGLFPRPDEIRTECSCPDWAGLCKHTAAVLYGIGAGLDKDPELFFRLREVDHLDLVSQAVDASNLDAALGSAEGSLAGEDLGAIFGIELDTGGTPADPETASPKPARPPRAKSRAGKGVKVPAKVKAAIAATGTALSRAKTPQKKAAAVKAARSTKPARRSAKTRAKSRSKGS